MPVSVDDELDTDPELRVELPCVATPKATLPQVGKQGDTVCHVTLHIERQRTAVDEGVPVVQRGCFARIKLRPPFRGNISIFYTISQKYLTIRPLFKHLHFRQGAGFNISPFLLGKDIARFT